MPTENQQSTKGFLPLKRTLLNVIKDGLLSMDGIALYLLILLEANPYNCELKTNYTVLSQTIPENKWSKSKVTKLMLELKALGLIEYPERSGKKGLFTIKVNKQFLESFSSKKQLASTQELATPLPLPAEVTTKKQGLDEARKALYKGLSSPSQLSRGKVTNNDKENDTEKDKNLFDVKSLPDSKKIPTESFDPNTREEARCKEIALALGESDMRFLLSCLKKSSLNEIETVYGLYREATGVKKPPAYFNTVWTERFTKRTDSDNIQDRTPI